MLPGRFVFSGSDGEATAVKIQTPRSFYSSDPVIRLGGYVQSFVTLHVRALPMIIVVHVPPNIYLCLR